ncbi:MAG TPA: HAMP domain-containing sensor histidine kinase [Dongiaceae bacterium]|nr:HAMP domain-containing sensor histidine kinase [Dongiaceae bacterium]
MAVTPPKPQLVKDFWPRFQRGAVLLIIVLQVLILVALALVLKSFGFFDNNPLAVAGALVAQSILGVVASLIVYHFVAQPVKNLLAALIHVAGEPTNLSPPNPNESHFEKSGLKPVLQTIYQLAADATDPIDEGKKALNGAVTISQNATASQSAPRTIIEAALNDTICGFVVMDQNRHMTYTNKATPVKVDTDGTKSLDLIFNEHDTLEKWWDDCDQNSVHAEKTWARISNKLPGEEDRRFFDVIASYNKGSESEMVITLVDRTHLYKVSEEELDFIAFAAHELRGPITVIRGYLDVMKDELDGVLEEDQKELFKRLEVSASKLSGYINNILNTSRYDRRHLNMHLNETTIASVYGSIRDDMDLRARSQNRLLTVSIPDDLPTIAADTASLGEVFGNLIDNAIKYSNEGGTIEIAAIAKGDMVEFSVTDHGIGMPGSVVSNLFQKFYRSHRSRETVAGTGIGLYISKAIVESHGGTISVRSEDGHGSTFSVSLPTYKAVADKLKAGNNGNEQLISGGGSWIKNHTMYRG